VAFDVVELKEPGMTAPTQGGLVVRLLFLHGMLVPALMTGVSTTAVLVAVITFVVRIFGVTAGYHRLFSHHAFATSRAFGFVLAWLGASSGQRGPLWWAAVHRRHHRTADTLDDVHSPIHKGLLFAHMGWILDKRNLQTRVEEVRDWAKLPELRFLDRFHVIAPASLVVALFVLGLILERTMPALGTSGLQLVAWGFVISTLAEIHVTSTVNSLAHRLGTHPFDTGDNSGNIWWLAVPTLGEAWHNNHHHIPGSVRQGFTWWQVDITYWVLRVLAVVGIVWDLREPAEAKLLQTASSS
jgi:stearoyl-CoA desaturase (Delta-9 desaturase)